MKCGQLFSKAKKFRDNCKMQRKGKESCDILFVARQMYKDKMHQCCLDAF